MKTNAEKMIEAIADELLADEPAGEVGEEVVCKNCRFNHAESYHDTMWCRDCQQKNRFESKQDKEQEITEKEIKEEFEKLKQVVEDKYSSKNAKKWLQNKYPYMKNHWNEHEHIDDNWVAKQMEQYHKEQTRGELKSFYLYVDDKWALGMLTDKVDEVVDEYLNQKP